MSSGMFGAPEPKPFDGEWEVVYNAHARATDVPVRVLRKAGLTPVVLDELATVGWQRGAAFRDYTVRIAVPPDQAKAARQILAQWERYSEGEADKTAGRLYRQIFSFLGLSTATAAVCLVFTREPGTVIGIGVLVGFIAVWLIPRKKPGRGKMK